MIIGSLFLLVLLLFFPSVAIAGSRYGASLWLTELLPTLLPFFIAIRLFQYCLPNAAGKRPFLLIGLLCGYPTGAALVTYQYDKHLFDKRTAYFYLGFVNNPSPMFILVFCGKNILNLSSWESFLLFVILIFSSFMGSILFRFLYNPRTKRSGECVPAPATDKKTSSAADTAHESPSVVLDRIILDSFRILATIGGYVILFSIFGQLVHAVLPEHSPFSLLICGMLEISSGISYLKTAILPILYKKVLALVILAFGGLSAAFQTSSILTSSELSVIPYLLNKLLVSILAGLMAFFLFGFA